MNLFLIFFWYLAIGFFLYILSLVVHEYGHLFVVRRYTKKKVKIRISKTGLSVGDGIIPRLTIDQTIKAIESGVNYGAILAFISFNPLIILIYYYGCRADIRFYYYLKLSREVWGSGDLTIEEVKLRWKRISTESIC